MPDLQAVVRFEIAAFGFTYGDLVTVTRRSDGHDLLTLAANVPWRAGVVDLPSHDLVDSLLRKGRVTLISGSDLGVSPLPPGSYVDLSPYYTTEELVAGLGSPVSPLGVAAREVFAHFSDQMLVIDGVPVPPSAVGAAAAGHTHPASDVSDATAVGQAVMTALTAAAARAAIGAGTSSLVLGTTAATAKPGDYIPPADAAAGTASMRTLGTGATQAAAGNDGRLSNARTPTAHAASHAVGGSDPVTPAAIGAAPTGHSHASADLTDLTEVVQDIVAAMLRGGTNVTVSYDDAAGAFTINATASTEGGTTDPEIVRDVIGGALVAGAGVQITVNDAGDTITVASTAVLPTRRVIAGTGLSGGGDLSADRTLAVVYGTAAGTAAAGNDGRLSNARTPTAHAASHAAAGADRITPVAIGAAPSVDLTTRPGLWWIAHRGGGALVFPEYSHEGIRAAAEAGFVVELDVRRLADGTLVPCHDATVDRTMTGTGNVSALTRAQWDALKLRPVNPGGDLYASTTVDQILDEWGGRVLLSIECKDSAAITAIINAIVARGLQRAVIVSSFTYADSKAAAAAGIAAMAPPNVATPATMVADGIEWVFCSLTETVAYLDSLKAAGLKPVLYTTRSIADANTAKSRTPHGIFSDDPWLHSGRYPWLRTDPFRTKQRLVPALGKVTLTTLEAWSPTENPFRLTEAGMWMDMATSGVANGITHTVRQTWAGQLPGIVTVRFRVRFDSPGIGDQSRWIGIYVGSLADDAAHRDGAYAGQGGYHCLVRRDGLMHIYRQGPSEAVRVAETVSGTAAEAIAPAGRGGMADIELKITATQIVMTNLGTGHTSTATDSTYRSAAGALSFSWRDVAAEISSVEIIA